MSLGVWLGLIALAGLDAEIGAIMLLYLDLAYAEAVEEGRMQSLEELQHAIYAGAVNRIRPLTMTVASSLLGLVPIMLGTETGADTMKRLAAPMIGGMVTTYLLALMIYPIIFYFYKRWDVKRRSVNPARQTD